MFILHSKDDQNNLLS